MKKAIVRCFGVVQKQKGAADAMIEAVNSLLCTKSDITAQALAYSLSVNIVKIFLCHLSNYCRNGISMR
jgi:hypothetical protein